jgi:SAM-dependent methyltransferase
MIQMLSPRRVFEFGSGIGRVLKEASARGIDIVGSETSEYAIRNSVGPKELLVKIGEIPQSRLPFEDDSFDLVFSTEVMEHVKEELTEAVLGELHRICSKRAFLTINTFDPNQPGHINMHPRKWWLAMLEQCGFRHDDAMWKRLEAAKYLAWDIYVLDKLPRQGDGADGDATA